MQNVAPNDHRYKDNYLCYVTPILLIQNKKRNVHCRAIVLTCLSRRLLWFYFSELTILSKIVLRIWVIGAWLVMEGLIPLHVKISTCKKLNIKQFLCHQCVIWNGIWPVGYTAQPAATLNAPPVTGRTTMFSIGTLHSLPNS